MARVKEVLCRAAIILIVLSLNILGIELKMRTTPALRGLRQHGVLALIASSLVLRLLPPLILTKEREDVAVETSAEVLG